MMLSCSPAKCVFRVKDPVGQRNGQIAAEVATQEAKLATAHEEVRHLLFERGRLQTESDQCQKKVEVQEANFRRQGGDLFSRRKELAAERESICAQIERIEHEMREMAGSNAPLLVVELQIREIRNQSMREETAEHQQVLLAELKKRDRAILRESKFAAEQSSRLEALFAADRKRRERAVEIERYLNLDKSALQSLQRL